LIAREHRFGDVHELAELSEIMAHQREVVPVIKAADRTDPRDPVHIAQLAITPPARTTSATWTIARCCGLAGWMSKYRAMRPP
jgi:hypothetical protein